MELELNNNLDMELTEQEEQFCDKLDDLLISEEFTEKEMGMIDDEPTLQMENFIVPELKHLPDGGGWIKVPTDTGFKVVFAKFSRRKMHDGQFVDKMSKLTSDLNAINGNKKLSSDKMVERVKVVNAKLHDLDVEWLFWKLHKLMETSPYFVKVQWTLSKHEYLLPNQYELLNSDISLLVSLDKNIKSITSNLKYKTKEDEDIIHYLQSRGIDRKTAIVMSRLDQCYFEVDVALMMHEAIMPI